MPFDPRLIEAVPAAVAKAAMDSGVARKPIADMNAYRTTLRGRLDPTASSLTRITETVHANPRRVVFAEGEDEKAIRAALAFRAQGFGTPVLIGRENRMADTIKNASLQGTQDLEIHNARMSANNKKYTDFLYAKLQRKGALYRDCERMVNQDRNVFAACMVACGDADAMVTGLTRSWMVSYGDIARVIDPPARASCRSA